MSNRSVYESSCKSAGPTCVQALVNASAAAQESINAAAANGGTSLAFGVSAANDAKIRAANQVLQAAMPRRSCAHRVTWRRFD
jgi:hypothetical protein